MPEKADIHDETGATEQRSDVSITSYIESDPTVLKREEKKSEDAKI